MFFFHFVADLERLVRKLYQRYVSCEEDKYDWEMKIRKQDFEVTLSSLSPWLLHAPNTVTNGNLQTLSLFSGLAFLMVPWRLLYHWHFVLVEVDLQNSDIYQSKMINNVPVQNISKIETSHYY